MLDKFANIGQIPKFEKLIAAIRSREISTSIILQSQSQLKAIYKDNSDTIVGNCDTTLFLGGKEKTTLKEISEILGKETIDSFNTSETRGRELSNGLNYQKLGKQLMTEDEIAVMDGGKCTVWMFGSIIIKIIKDTSFVSLHMLRFPADVPRGEKSISPRYFSVRSDSRIFPLIQTSPASSVFVGILPN